MIHGASQKQVQRDPFEALSRSFDIIGIVTKPVTELGVQNISRWRNILQNLKTTQIYAFFYIINLLPSSKNILLYSFWISIWLSSAADRNLNSRRCTLSLKYQLRLVIPTSFVVSSFKTSTSSIWLQTYFTTTLPAHFHISNHSLRHLWLPPFRQLLCGPQQCSICNALHRLTH